jgi:hypothetical protein
VSSNQVSVLTDVAETAKRSMQQGAKTDREEAEKELAAHSTAAAEENDAIRERLDLANARLSLTQAVKSNIFGFCNRIQMPRIQLNGRGIFERICKENHLTERLKVLQSLSRQIIRADRSPRGFCVF